MNTGARTAEVRPRFLMNDLNFGVDFDCIDLATGASLTGVVHV